VRQGRSATAATDKLGGAVLAALHQWETAITATVAVVRGAVHVSIRPAATRPATRPGAGPCQPATQRAGVIRANGSLVGELLLLRVILLLLVLV